EPPTERDRGAPRPPRPPEAGEGGPRQPAVPSAPQHDRSRMIEADLAVTGIAELATPLGNSALTGPSMGRLAVVRDAAVACLRGKIVFTGPERDLRDAVSLQPGARLVDAAGGTVLPGFVDAHTHLPFAGWRDREFEERLRGVSYEEIASRGGGILSTVDATRAASRADLVEAVRSRLDAM